MTIILCYGGMRSGKTDDAISRIEAYHNFGLRTVLFQPQKNVRDVQNGRPVWKSKNQTFGKKTFDAEWYTSFSDIEKIAKDFDVFGFDEHHWYPEDYLETIDYLEGLKKIIFSVGLDFYHNGQPVENYWILNQSNKAILRQGIGAFCDIDLKKNVKTLATRTQLLVDGEPAYFDTPTDIPESEQDRYRYFPVSLENWQVKPPRDPTMNRLYERWFLQAKKS